MSTVTIAERFCGPPSSGNGGYTCGLAAAPLGTGPVEVTLREPPPLGRPLARVVTDTGAELRDGSRVVASARRVDVRIETPAPVDPETAARAVAAFDVDAYHAAHAYPGCFTCGPARADGDGLRLFPGPTDRPDVVAWPWAPSARDLDGGEIAAPVLWAALDCPGGTAWLRDPDLGPIVLGRLTVEIDRRPGAGEALVVAGWTGARDGRRLGAGTAVWTGAGERIAAASATWIVLTPDQAAAFGATGSRS